MLLTPTSGVDQGRACYRHPDFRRKLRSPVRTTLCGRQKLLRSRLWKEICPNGTEPDCCRKLAPCASHGGQILGVPPSWLLSAGVFFLGAAVAALVISAIPLILELRSTARRMQQLADTLEKEIPDTAATMRLTGLEMSDAIQEVSLLSLDVANGLQASARMVQTAEGGIKQSVAYLQSATADTILPAVRQRLPVARGRVEGLLLRNSKLPYSEQTVLQLAGALKIAAKRFRFTLAAINIVRGTFPERYVPPQSRST